MRWARHGLIVAALLVAVSLVVSTGGVSSTVVERSMGGAVVADDEAYLGVQRDCVDSVLRVTITNRFAPGTTLDVDIAVNGTTKTIDDLAVGESQTREFGTFETDDTITIDASDAGISVHLTRELPDGC